MGYGGILLRTKHLLIQNLIVNSRLNDRMTCAGEGADSVPTLFETDFYSLFSLQP